MIFFFIIFDARSYFNPDSNQKRRRFFFLIISVLKCLNDYIEYLKADFAQNRSKAAFLSPSSA